jgi:hypothetical protein
MIGTAEGGYGEETREAGALGQENATATAWEEHRRKCALPRRFAASPERFAVWPQRDKKNGTGNSYWERSTDLDERSIEYHV